MPAKTNKVRIICQLCGMESFKLPCRMKDGHKHFCSRKCRDIFSHRDFRECFWEKVDKISNNNGCWQWTGCLDTAGYGMLRVAGNNKKAHRVSYEIHYGEIPFGIQVLHRCDNRKCVNPTHFFLGTNQDNVDDKVKKQRQACGIALGIKISGELCGHAKLTWVQVAQIRTLRKSGMTLKELASQFSVNAISTISEIINNKTWREERHAISE